MLEFLLLIAELSTAFHRLPVQSILLGLDDFLRSGVEGLPAVLWTDSVLEVLWTQSIGEVD